MRSLGVAGSIRRDPTGPPKTPPCPPSISLEPPEPPQPALTVRRDVEDAGVAAVLRDGRLRIDSNCSEREVRKVVCVRDTGRAAWP